jgi:hypothetical protein
MTGYNDFDYYGHQQYPRGSARGEWDTTFSYDF